MAGLAIELFVAALEDGLAPPQLAESGQSGFECVAAGPGVPPDMLSNSSPLLIAPIGDIRS